MTCNSCIELVVEESHLLYRISGNFDAAAVKVARGVIDEQVDAAQNLHILDMANTIFIDSSGVGAIVYLFERLAAKDKELVILGLSGQPADLIKMLRIDKIIETDSVLDDLLKRAL